MAGSSDGKILIIGGPFGDPAIRSVPEGRELHRLPGTSTKGTIHQVPCSPDGRTVAFDRKVWDADTGRLLRVLRAPGEPEGFIPPACTTFYAPDGRRAITVERRVIYTWDVTTGEPAAPAIRSERIPGAPAALSADGRPLATGGIPRAPGLAPPHDPWIHVWEVATGREVARMPTQEGSVSGVVLSPDGGVLASFRPDQGGDRDVDEPQPQDPTIRLWSVATGRELRRLVGHRGPVNAAVFTPDGRSLISAGQDATAMVWDVSDL